VLGRVIEIVSGETLYHFMKQHILDPLGMNHTKFALDTPQELTLMAEPLPSELPQPSRVHLTDSCLP
jgi:CubicO group peptidase (beta-lactamase class C family)